MGFNFGAFAGGLATGGVRGYALGKDYKETQEKDALKKALGEAAKLSATEEGTYTPEDVTATQQMVNPETGERYVGLANAPTSRASEMDMKRYRVGDQTLDAKPSEAQMDGLRTAAMANVYAQHGDPEKAMGLRRDAFTMDRAVKTAAHQDKLMPLTEAEAVRKDNAGKETERVQGFMKAFRSQGSAAGVADFLTNNETYDDGMTYKVLGEGKGGVTFGMFDAEGKQVGKETFRDLNHAAQWAETKVDPTKVGSYADKEDARARNSRSDARADAHLGIAQAGAGRAQSEAERAAAGRESLLQVADMKAIQKGVALSSADRQYIRNNGQLPPGLSDSLGMSKPTNASSRIAREGEYVVFPDGTSELAENLPRRQNAQVDPRQEARDLVVQKKISKEEANRRLQAKGFAPI